MPAGMAGLPAMGPGGVSMPGLPPGYTLPGTKAAAPPPMRSNERAKEKRKRKEARKQRKKARKKR